MSQTPFPGPARVLACLVVAGAVHPALAASPDDEVLEEVVVRGEKFERSLQDTPTSVAVTTEERILQENLLTLQDVYNRTANVSETYGSAGFTLRGISNTGVSGGGGAPVATVYVDDIALPSQILYGSPTDLWDVQQVEILRGPQSTLQGLNTLAGAVVLTTNEPGTRWNGRVRYLFDNRDEDVYSAAVGGPLLGDQLGIRLAAERRLADRYIWNTTRNEPEDPLESTNVRGTLTFRPTALPGFEGKLTYIDYEREGGYSFMYTDTSVQQYFDNRTNSSDYPNTGDVDLQLGNVNLSYALNDAWRIASITSFTDGYEFTSFDNDFGPEQGGFGSQDRDYKSLSEELRLSFNLGRFEGLIGAYYYHNEQSSGTDSLSPVETPVGTISAVLQGNGVDAPTAEYIAGLYAAALPVIPVNYSSLGEQEVNTYALFADARWHLTEKLDLLAGFRWDREKNELQSDSAAEFAGTYPNPDDYGAPGSDLWFAIAGINQAVEALVSQAGASTPQLNRKFNAFLPKLGLSYDVTDDITAAFVAQRAYRSGGSSQNIARAIVVPYDPEYAWNYEVSLRTSWFDNRLMLNANAYYMDWRDQQVDVNFGLNDFDYHVVNAGESRLYGAELELSHYITPNFDWYASLGTTDTKFEEFTVTEGSVEDLSGLEFHYAPKLTAGAGVNFRWADGFSANVNVNYRSKVFSDIGVPQSQYRVGSRTLVNARVGYQADHFGVSVYANNLLDEHYIQYDALSEGRAVLGAPSVFGLMLEARF